MDVTNVSEFILLVPFINNFLMVIQLSEIIFTESGTLDSSLATDKTHSYTSEHVTEIKSIFRRRHQPPL